MRRVIKVGGSLLLRVDLQQALPAWIEHQSRAENLVVVGGGELVDAVRRLDEVRSFDTAQTHWLCVDLLETTFRLFTRWFDWPCVETKEELAIAGEQGFATTSPTIVSVGSFYGRDNPDVLPLDWRTTSDSIAALLAARTDADELALLKSCDVDSAANVDELAARGIVDEALPMTASSVRAIRVEQLC